MSKTITPEFWEKRGACVHCGEKFSEHRRGRAAVLCPYTPPSERCDDSSCEGGWHHDNERGTPFRMRCPDHRKASA